MVPIKINLKWLIVSITTALVLIGYFYLEQNKKPKITKQSAQLGMVNEEKIDELIKPTTPTQASAFGEPGWFASNKIEKNKQQQPVISDPSISIKTDDQIQALLKINDALAGLDINDPKAPDQLIKLIQEIEKKNGTSVLSGIRLDVLRENLEHASKLKAITNKILDLEKSNTNEALEEKKKLTQMSLDIVGKFRSDVVVKPPNQLTPN